MTGAEGDPAEAAVLQGAAAPMWEAVGPPLFGSGCFSAPRALCEQRAGEELGGKRFRSYAAEGSALPLDAAVCGRCRGGGRPGCRHRAGPAEGRRPDRSAPATTEGAGPRNAGARRSPEGTAGSTTA